MLFNKSLPSTILPHTERRQKRPQSKSFISVGQLGVPAKSCINKRTWAHKPHTTKSLFNTIASISPLVPENNKSQVLMSTSVNPSRAREPGMWCYPHCPALPPPCPYLSSQATVLTICSLRGRWYPPAQDTPEGNPHGLSLRMTLCPSYHSMTSINLTSSRKSLLAPWATWDTFFPQPHTASHDWHVGLWVHLSP